MTRGAAWRAPALAHALAALALWPIPLLGMLHAEGAATTAFASFFIAGIAAVGAYSRGVSDTAIARRHLALLLVPLVLLGATALWRPNCGILQGLGLFALLVPPSALLAVGLASVVTAFEIRRPRLLVLGMGLALAVVPTVLVLKLRPQLFVYNPVFGGVLGPIYDAELAIRPGLFAHQAAVVVAAVGLVALARWRRQSDAVAGRVALAFGAVIAIVSVFNTPLGITQSESSLSRALPGEAASDHLVIHYVPGTITAARLDALLDEGEFRLWQIERALGVGPSQTVHVYLYPDPGSKAALIGSRETSVVPVWLPSPQVHLLDERADGDLGHELVHVVARERGGAITGATWRVGLVEGLAVALEAPEGLPSAEQQATASLALPAEQGGMEDPAEAVIGAMDPFGFWTGRAGAAYSTTGAFTRWILEREGAAPLLEVYGGASWEAAYGRPLAELAASWAEHLRTVEVSDEATAYAAWRFGLPSLFEVQCPHHVPAWVRSLRDGDEEWERGRLWATGHLYTRSILASPDSVTRIIPYGRLVLAGALQRLDIENDLESTRGLLQADTARALLQPRLELAHAARLLGAGPEVYGDPLAALPPYAHSSRATILLLSRLQPDELRATLWPAADSTEASTFAGDLARGSAEARVFAAFRYSESGDPLAAWRSMQTALPSVDSLGVAERASLDVIASRMAYRAKDLAAADSLTATAARRFQTSGLEAPARLAFDLRERILWQRSLGP